MRVKHASVIALVLLCGKGWACGGPYLPEEPSIFCFDPLEIERPTFPGEFSRLTSLPVPDYWTDSDGNLIANDTYVDTFCPEYGRNRKRVHTWLDENGKTTSVSQSQGGGIGEPPVPAILLAEQRDRDGNIMSLKECSESDPPDQPTFSEITSALFHRYGFSKKAADVILKATSSLGEEGGIRWAVMTDFVRTVTAERVDLQGALEQMKIPADTAQKMQQGYDEFRRELGTYVYIRLLQHIVQDRSYGEEREEVNHWDNRFDMSPYESSLNALPPEFALYLRGAAAYHCQEYGQAIAHWEDLLKLPESERTHRSAWALYMLGRVYSTNDPARSIEYLTRSRQLLGLQARDPLALSDSALGWIARAEAENGQTYEAIRDYLEFAGKSGNLMPGYHSIIWVLTHKAFAGQEIDSKLAQDPRVRDLVTAWLLSDRWHYHQVEGKAWLAALKKTDIPGPMPGADRLACLAYQCGDMAAAGEWLEHADIGSELTQDVQKKWLMHEGRWNEVLLLPLRDWDKGLIHLAQGKYMKAMEEFSGLESDYIAEQVLTIEELETYVKMFDGRYACFLAVRLADSGQWKKAAQYGSSNPEYAVVAQNMGKARDAKLPFAERARSLFESAGIVAQGRLTARFYAPDWQSRMCRPEEPRPNSLTSPSADETARVKRHKPRPNRKEHYLWTAADLMWQCALLLPDNDPLCAEALYRGGCYIKIKDPKGADKFYKALVRRNPNLEIAQKAAKLHWFPAEFSARVLYTPRPFWSRRRIAAAAASGITAASLAGAGFLYFVMKKRRASTHIS